MKKLLSALLVLTLLFSTLIPTIASAKCEEYITARNDLSDELTTNNPDDFEIIETEDGTVIHHGKISPEDIVRITSTALYDARGRSSIRFEFPGLETNAIASDFADNVINEGESATLSVNTCVWAPEYNDLDIGIYNWTTAYYWSVTHTGGEALNCSHTFSNLTAGTYSVFVRNLGQHTLTTGYITYNLT